MKKHRNALILLKISAILVLFAAPASAVTVPFSHDFEDVTVGAYPVTDGWQTWSSGVTAYVTDAYAFSGEKSFLLHSYSFLPRCDFVLLDTIPDVVSFEAALLMDPNPGRVASLGLADGAAQMLYYNSFTVYSADGITGFVVFKGAAGTAPVDVGQFVVGEWIHLAADLDFSSLTGNLWLDGVLMVEGVSIAPRQFTDTTWGEVALDRFSVSETNWSGGRIGMIYVDDVAVLNGEAAPQEPPAIDAVVEVAPSNLKLNNRGKIVNVFVELPEGYAVEDVDLASLLLNGSIPMEDMPATVGDFDLDGVLDLTVKFSRQALLDTLSVGEQEVTLEGCLIDETPFIGACIISVKS